MTPAVVIDLIGGNCPVQAEGTIGGEPFYFRARGARWSIGVGGEPVGAPVWHYEEPYGDWPEAGWITEEEARAFIAKAAGLWAARATEDPREETPAP